MKYIKIFENFETSEKMDYTPDNIKNILKERNVSYNNISYIGEGNYGAAYSLNNGLVLKITDMDSEVYYANKLKDISSDYLIDIKDIFFHKYTDIGYNVRVGFIIMEELDMNKGKYFKRFIDKLNVYDSIKNKPNITDEDILEYFKERLSFLEEVVILKYWKIYTNIIRECKKYDIPTDDLRGGNIGFRGDKPIFFDIGDIYKSYNHDYSNIDIIDLHI